MEQKPPIHHLIKGIVIAAVLMLLNFVVRRQGGVALPVILQLLPTLLLLAGIIGACLMFGAQTNGAMPRGDIFAHGFKTTAMVTFLMAVYTFIIVKFVFPHSASEIDDAVKMMVEKDNRMEQEARRIAESGFKRAWIFDVGGAIFATLITGLVGSFIGATFAKKKP